jgi:hypothetical protein
LPRGGDAKAPIAAINGIALLATGQFESDNPAFLCINSINSCSWIINQLDKKEVQSFSENGSQ